MAKSAAAYRLRKELADISRDRPEFVWATHKESNILLWSFLLAPPADTVYGGGWYWGRLTFPAEYPFKPPSIIMVTPSDDDRGSPGRFQPDHKICMSMSDYHPESWNPAWSIATILKGVLSFMVGEENTTGSVEASAAERRALAAASVAWNQNRPEFVTLFPDFDDIRHEELLRRTTPKHLPPCVAPHTTHDPNEDSHDDRPPPPPSAHETIFTAAERHCIRGDLDKAASCAADEAQRTAYREAAEAKARGDAAFRAGRYDKARTEYAASLARAPNCAAVLRNRAASSEKLGDDAAVVADATRALDLDAALGDAPSLKALTRRANALERQGNVAEARRDYDAAIAQNPPNVVDLAQRLANLATAAAPGANNNSKKKRRKKKKKKKPAKAQNTTNDDDDDDDDPGDNDDQGADDDDEDDDNDQGA